MARLAAKADLNFIPTPDGIHELLLSYVAAPPDYTGQILDPCAGEGAMIAAWAGRFGLDRAAVYANELHDTRAAACKKQADHVLSCDALRSLQASRGFAQFAWLNPPFDWAGGEEGGGRMEPKFYRRVLEDGRWLQTGAIMAYDSPEEVIGRQESLNHFARCLDDVTMWRLPDEQRHFREVIVFGVVREHWRVGREQRDTAEQLKSLLQAGLPPLALQPTARYTLPLARPVTRVVWRDASLGTTTVAQQDVIASGGAWASKAYRTAARMPTGTVTVPLFPLTKVHAAGRIASGEINGETVELNGRELEIKGSTVEGALEYTEEKETEKTHIVEKHRIVRRVPHVVTVDRSGRIGRYVGDKGMAALMETPGAAEVLLGTVKRKAPALYQLDITPDVATILTAIRPASGRSLPGQAAGLLPMQRHVVAAAYRALTTANPATGETADAVIINAEMGCGKSALALSLAETLRRLTPTNRRARGRRLV